MGSLFEPLALFDALPIGVLELDDEGRVLDGNRMGLALAAERRDELAEQRAEGRLLVLRDAALDEVARDATPLGEVSPERPRVGPRRYVLRLADDALQVVDVTAASVDGRIVVALDPVGPRERVGEEAARRRSHMRRRERVAALGTLASGLVHEIGNPLQVIANYAALIERAADNPEAIKQMSAGIREEVSRLRTLLERVLGFARQARVTLGAASLADVVDEAVGPYRETLARDSVSLRLGLPPETPVVPADRTALIRTVQHLVDNAHREANQRSEDGNAFVSVRAEAVEREGREYARIAVENSGGLPPTDRVSRLFDAFFTTRAPGEGQGLGLSEVDRIAEAHGGELYVEEREGGGVRAIFEWPLREPEGDGG